MVLTENSVIIRTAEAEMNRQVRCQTGFFNGGSIVRCSEKTTESGDFYSEFVVYIFQLVL